mmetsp:Transcript_96508/g.258064  ORF Transcript_96508/g.258064 Transcript_96508/m.258064 type:complete len:248 (+) Transcript_96508:15-758(+)
MLRRARVYGGRRCFSTAALKAAVAEQDVFGVRRAAGSHIDWREDATGSLILEAARLRNADLVKVLLDSGANPNFKDENGTTPLHICAQIGSTHATRFLVQKGGYIHARDREGRMPIHLAGISGVYMHMVRALMRYGADPDRKDSYSKNAWQYMEETGDQQGLLYMKHFHGLRNRTNKRLTTRAGMFKCQVTGLTLHHDLQDPELTFTLEGYKPKYNLERKRPIIVNRTRNVWSDAKTQPVNYYFRGA